MNYSAAELWDAIKKRPDLPLFFAHLGTEAGFSQSDTNLKCYNQSEALNELSNYKLPVLPTYRLGIGMNSACDPPRPRSHGQPILTTSPPPAIISFLTWGNAK